MSLIQSVVVDHERGGTVVGNILVRDWTGKPIKVVDNSGKIYVANGDDKFEEQK